MLNRWQGYDTKRVGGFGRTLLLVSVSAIGMLTGCASGSFTSHGSGTTPVTTTNSNSPSLPPLSAATAVNTYVGTQTPGSNASENMVSLKLDQTNSTYDYSDADLPGATPDPVANSTGGYAPWVYFDALGDTKDQTGLGPGPQYYGVAMEEPSRLAFAAPGTANGQIAALVPTQTTGCITPTAAATYEFVVLPGPDTLPLTDAAWGTVQVSATGSSFSFTGVQQFSESSSTASTGLIPFGAASCIRSPGHSELGYFIDTPASSANGNTEIRAFLGPTGLLAANLQGIDASGDPVALPGLIGMVQPPNPVDVTQVAGSPSRQVVYRSLIYQPAAGGAQYGLYGQDPLGYLLGVGFDSFLSETKTAGLFGNWQSITSNITPYTANQGIVFGAQDSSHPGLFPHAKFLYPNLLSTALTCPSGTEYFPGANPTPKETGFCSSPAVVMVAQHDGKYVIFVSGIYVTAGNAPTVMVLLQE